MASVTSRTGRVELGHGCYAWIAGDAGWGMSNAGLITGRGESLLVDTLYDLRLTKTMLDALTPLTAPAPISTVVNTHGNGDHWFGNQLVSHAEIIAARGSVADMRQVGPAEMRALTGMDSPGRTLRRAGSSAASTTPASNPFSRTGSSTARPSWTSAARRSASSTWDPRTAPATRSSTCRRPAPSTPATSSSPERRRSSGTVPSPTGSPPATCCSASTPDIVVPGHGPVTTKQAVREIRDYLEYVHEQATARFTAGMPAMDAARDSASAASPTCTRANASPSTCTPSTGSSTPRCPHSTAPDCSAAWPSSATAL